MVNYFLFFYFFFKKFIYFLNIDLKFNIYIFFLKKKYILDFFFFFKKSLFFKYNLLIDMSIVDFLLNKNRFLLYYNLLSVFFNFRIYIYFFFNDFIIFNNNLNTFIYSISNIYLSANWLEREIWDMFGIFFINHKDLRRILTDYGFLSYPLRKDFPLTGFLEVRYDDTLKNIVIEKLKLTQEFRVFNFINPWAL